MTRMMKPNAHVGVVDGHEREHPYRDSCDQWPQCEPVPTVEEIIPASEETAPAPMRLRVLHLPRDQFAMILDRAPDSLFEGDDESVLTGLSRSMVDRLEGCAGILAFNDPVEMEAWYPYG